MKQWTRETDNSTGQDAGRARRQWPRRCCHSFCNLKACKRRSEATTRGQKGVCTTTAHTETLPTHTHTTHTTHTHTHVVEQWPRIMPRRYGLACSETRLNRRPYRVRFVFFNIFVASSINFENKLLSVSETLPLCACSGTRGTRRPSLLSGSN